MIGLLMSCLLGMSAGSPAVASPVSGFLTLAPPQEARPARTPAAQAPVSQMPRNLQDQYRLREAIAGDLDEFRGGGIGLLLLIAVAVVVVVVLIVLL